jgi:hypothetical protein
MFRYSIGIACWSFLVSAIALWVLAPISAVAAIGSWDTPALDRWFHQGDTAPGLKPDMSTFASFGPGTADSQARAGAFMLGFNTADQVLLAEPEQYQIHSIRITLDYVDESRIVPYDPTHDTVENLIGNTDQDPGKPIELFGVGFGNEYTKLGIGPNNAAPPEFEESSSLVSNGGFNVFPLGDDGTGNFGNIFNSSGGEGIYEGDELVEITREPWDAAPWAVGASAGLTPGAIIPPLAEFSFEVNLTLPGVLEYFQQNLSIGQVAVFISSLHSAAGHSGGSGEDFPAFHSKESQWVEFGLASPPTLEIDFTILPESNLPGDFDGDGDADDDDLSDWRASYGMSPGGDADEDSDTDGRDFLIWQRNYTGSNPLISTAVVPEPTSLTVVIFGIIMGLPSRLTFSRAH